MFERSAGNRPIHVEDRRRRQRIGVHGIAIVSIERRQILGDAVDISPDGVCLTLPRALEIGSTCRLDLEIECPTRRSTSVVARVCFCLEGESGFRVGLNCLLDKFLDGGTPDRLSVDPQGR